MGCQGPDVVRQARGGDRHLRLPLPAASPQLRASRRRLRSPRGDRSQSARERPARAADDSREPALQPSAERFGLLSIGHRNARAEPWRGRQDVYDNAPSCDYGCYQPAPLALPLSVPARLAARASLALASAWRRRSSTSGFVTLRLCLADLELVEER